MDMLQSLKDGVRRALSQHAFPDQTYSQALEAACRLVYGAPSLNHFTAAPATYSDTTPPSMTEALRRIQHAEGFFAAERSDEVEGYERIELWEQAAKLWLLVIGCEHKQSPLLSILEQAADFNQLPIPMTIGSSGTPSPITDPSVDLPDLVKLRFVLSAWLPMKEGEGRSLLIQLWDQLESLALRQGYSEAEASYYRSLCRESYNHSWSLESMVLLGVLDASPGDGSFFRRFPDRAKGFAIMKAMWALEEPEGM